MGKKRLFRPARGNFVFLIMPNRGGKTALLSPSIFSLSSGRKLHAARGGKKEFLEKFGYQLMEGLLKRVFG